MVFLLCVLAHENRDHKNIKFIGVLVSEILRGGAIDEISIFYNFSLFAALAQMVACLPLVKQVRGSIPGGVVNFHFKFSTSGLGGVVIHTF